MKRILIIASLAVVVATASHELAAQSRDMLGVGDLVRIIMQEDPKVRFDGAISASGTVPIPFFGEFRIAGLDSDAATAGLEAALTEALYQKATVSVSLVEKAPGNVYVYGAVKTPGTVNMPRIGEVSVLQLISAVGGLTSWASPEDAFLLRRDHETGQPQKIPVNLAEIFAAHTLRLDPEADPEDVLDRILDTSQRGTGVVVRADDVLCIPGVSGDIQQVMTTDVAEVVIVGEINSPGIITFAPGEPRTVMRAVFKAGGFSKFARSKAVRLIRYGKNAVRSEQTVDVAVIMDEGYLDQDVELLPGDMLIVPQRMINF